jgi:hypothetical protein
MLADIIAAAPCRAHDPADSFPFAAAQGKSYAQFGTMLATELEALRSRPPISGLRRNRAFVPRRHAGLIEVAFQQ